MTRARGLVVLLGLSLGAPACVLLGYEIEPPADAGGPTVDGDAQSTVTTTDGSTDASAAAGEPGDSSAAPSGRPGISEPPGEIAPECVGMPDGSACDDGSSCTEGDVCENGRCVGSAIDCAAASGDPCRPYACDDGACVPGPLAPDGTPCGEGGSCSHGECATVTDCSAADDSSCFGRTCVAPAPVCLFPCEQDGTCTQFCQNASECHVQCADADRCHTTCEDTATCHIDCTTDLCFGDCRGDGVRCVFDCRNAEECTNIICKEEAVCLLFCGDDDSNCSFYGGGGCDAPPIYCDGIGAWVCGDTCENVADFAAEL